MLLKRQLFLFTIALSLGLAALLSGCLRNPKADIDAPLLSFGNNNLDSKVAGWMKGPVSVNTTLATDISASARSHEHYEPLLASACKAIKPELRTKDQIRFVPFAAKATTTHVVELTDRLAMMGICKDENFMAHITGDAITSDVADAEETNLFRMVQKLQPSKTDKSDDLGTDTGDVIVVIVHADDQGMGADEAVPLANTAEQMEALLVDSNTALVLFAIDGDLRRGLEASLEHPQALISPLSEDSIKHAMEWAYELARSPVAASSVSVPNAGTEKTDR